MTDKDWVSGFAAAFTGAIYGASLLAMSLFLAGGGHGTYLPLAVFAAPFSLTGGVLGALVFVLLLWVVFGFVLGTWRRPLVPAGILVVHAVSVGAILRWGSAYESADEQWRRLDSLWSSAGGVVTFAMSVYILGQLTAWGLVVFRFVSRDDQSPPAAASP